MPPKETENRPYLALLIVLALALAHGLLYVFLVPPWQHYDEPNHFEYAWLAARRPGLPQPGDYDLEMRRQVAASMIANGFFTPGDTLPDLGSTDRPPWIGPFAQLGDPPLYYLLAGLPLRLLPEADIETQLYSARLVSLGFYLLSILAAFGVARVLFAPGSALRWLGPLTLALIPGYADLMTAVNADAGGVAFFCLFIWGGVGLVRQGFSWPRTLGAGTAALLAFWARTTLAITFPLFGLALLLSLARGPRRRWLWLALLGGGAAGLLAALTWQDAAYWYRATAQPSPTRIESPAAPVGTHALALLASAPRTPSWVSPLSQPVPVEVVQALAGETVTLGVWMWASQPASTLTPGLHTGGERFQEPVSLGTAPEFFAFSAALAENSLRAWVTIEPPADPGMPGLQVYYDGLVLAAGDRPADRPPSFADPEGREGLWGEGPFTNLLRNGSAERAWPAFSPWIDDLGARLLPDQSRLSMILYSLLDPAAAGWYYQAAGARLFRTFWGQFGWGQVPLAGRRPYRLLGIFSLIGVAGAGLSLWRKRHVPMGDILAWLVLLTLSIWGAAFVRGAIYISMERVFLPVARYAYPAVIPTVFFLALGWHEVLRRSGRWLNIRLSVLYGMYIAVLLSVDAASVISLVRYFSER